MTVRSQTTRLSHLMEYFVPTVIIPIFLTVAIVLIILIHGAAS